jgi:hypothetical protein
MRPGAITVLLLKQLECLAGLPTHKMLQPL